MGCNALPPLQCDKRPSVRAAVRRRRAAAGDRLNIPDPPYFRNELVFPPVSDAFLAACAELIRTVGRTFALSHDILADVSNHVAEIGVMIVEMEPGVLRLALRNMDGIYGRPKIDIGRPIEKVTVRSAFPVTTVRPKGSMFNVVVPPRGIVVCDVYTTENSEKRV